MIHCLSFRFTVLSVTLISLFSLPAFLFSQTPDITPFIDESGAWGYESLNKKIVIKPKYEYAGRFADGLAPVKIKGKFGYIDTKEKTVIPFDFDNAFIFVNGTAFVAKAGKYGVVNTSGKILILPKYDEIGEVVSGKATVVRVGKKSGLVSLLGNEILAPEYDKIQSYPGQTFIDISRNGVNRRIDIDVEIERFAIETAIGNNLPLTKTEIDKTIRYEIVDKVALSNANKTISLKSLAQMIGKGFNDAEKFRFIFRWTSENIRWQKGIGQTRNAEEIITQKQGTSLEIAKFVTSLAQLLGIESITIKGFSGFIPKASETYLPDGFVVNHAWNLVKIQNRWYILDAVRGSGFVQNPEATSFVKSFDNSFFLPEPTQFVIEQMPLVGAAQLILPPVNKGIFITNLRQKERNFQQEQSQKKAKGELLQSVTNQEVAANNQTVKNTQEELSIAIANKRPLPKAEVLKKIRIEIIDPYALNTPPSALNSITTLAAYLKQPAQNDFEKARAAFRWIAGNIKYDADGLLRRAALQPTDAESVFRNKVCVCEGYANLSKELLSAMGLEVLKISGNAKGFGYAEDGEVSNNHAWNAVKLEGRWYFFESTWGSGYLGADTRAVSDFNEFFFLTPPEQLAYTHFPMEPLGQPLQFLEKPLSAKEFQQRPRLMPAIFQYGIKLEPQLHTMNASTGQPAQLSMTIPAEEFEVIEYLYDEGGRRVVGVEKNRKENTLQYVIKPEISGQYLLKIYRKKMALNIGLIQSFTFEPLYECRIVVQ